MAGAPHPHLDRRSFPAAPKLKANLGSDLKRPLDHQSLQTGRENIVHDKCRSRLNDKRGRETDRQTDRQKRGTEGGESTDAFL